MTGQRSLPLPYLQLHGVFYLITLSNIKTLAVIQEREEKGREKERREGEGREGKGRERKEREGKGREGREDL